MQSFQQHLKIVLAIHEVRSDYEPLPLVDDPSVDSFVLVSVKDVIFYVR
jgi:hypothetical protein